MLKLAISGCLGRMGNRITQLALHDTDFQVTTLLEHAENPQLGKIVEGITITSDPAALDGCDVLIEFTSPGATLEHLQACRQHHVKAVIGTTGLSADQIQTIQEASGEIPIVYSSNMSIGVNILFQLARQLAQSGPSSYRVTMREAHHVHKKDAPSGTAKTLKKIIEDNSSHKVPEIEAVREDEIVGDHKIVFESDEDTLTLDHHAKSRDIFVKGALVAAKFLAGKDKGLFTMQDVLGLK